MIKRILYTLLIMFPVVASAQINTDRVMAIGRNALYFEDYVLIIMVVCVWKYWNVFLEKR